mmetsp:Transcript_18159/g.43901  ORF Transcript_18159/g.43901 Transcript_18159/m.43901 type:complete len:347 (-) Transcript_18159:130-1170(-)
MADVASSGRQRCWLQVSIGGEVQSQPIVIELKVEKCPKTCRSFIALCSESSRDDKTTKQGPLPTYRGCEFHRIVPGFCVQSGDFERFDGTGGYSPLFGRNFPDENLGSKQNKHDQEGVVSMANSGPNTQGSQFFITLKSVPHLDSKHVVFGQVIAGMDVVHKMAEVERDAKDRPIQMQRIRIEDCGTGSGSGRSTQRDGDGNDDNQDSDADDEQRKRKMAKKESERDHKRSSSHKSSSSIRRRRKKDSKKKSSSKKRKKEQKRKRRRDDEERSSSSDDDYVSSSSSSSSSRSYSDYSEEKRHRKRHKKKEKDKKRRRTYSDDDRSSSSSKDEKRGHEKKKKKKSRR